MRMGYAGSMTRSSDAVVVNRVNVGGLVFGAAVQLNPDNTVSALNESSTDERFLGFAVRIVKQQQDIHETLGNYRDGELTDVMVRGSMAVHFRGAGAPTAGGAVYIRTALNPALPGAQVGDVESAPDGANSIQVTNARFTTGSASDGLVEVTITERSV
jgi:hypothetical protein